MTAPTDTTTSAIATMPFTFEGAQFRATTREDEPWFVLPDTCKVLEINNSRDAAARLDADEKGVVIIDTPGGPQKTTIISESGLYSLILTSRKPAAKRFKKWVTAEVLPAIRKTGAYVSPAAIPFTREQLVAQALIWSHEAIVEKDAQIERLQVKATRLDQIAGTAGEFCITDAAKALQVKPKELFEFLAANGWTYRRPVSGKLSAYQSRIAAGEMVLKVQTLVQRDGSEKTIEQVKVTPKGLVKLTTLVGPGATRGLPGIH